MKYSVHRFDINMTKDQSRLEQFLNKLEGEVVAIIPNIRPKFMLMGATAVLDFLFIVEKVGWEESWFSQNFPKRIYFTLREIKGAKNQIINKEKKRGT